ncbi:hypothetical protein ACLOJK_008149 [Asimina triloba]
MVLSSPSSCIINTAKGAKVFSAAIAATGDVQQTAKDGEEKLKLHTHSYCCLDYAQKHFQDDHDVSLIVCALGFSLHCWIVSHVDGHLHVSYAVMRFLLPPDLFSWTAHFFPSATIFLSSEAIYSALDALRLISPNDEYFHCEKCNGELVAESDKLAAEEMGDGDDNARRRRREKLKDMLQKIEPCHWLLMPGTAPRLPARARLGAGACLTGLYLFFLLFDVGVIEGWLFRSQLGFGNGGFRAVVLWVMTTLQNEIVCP